MKIEKLRIIQGDGPVAVNVSLSNLRITGLSKLALIENQVSSKDFSWITSIRVPLLRIDANYQMKGRVLLIPLNGKGSSWFEVSNLKSRLFTKTSLYVKQGHVFYNVTSCKVHFTMSAVRFRMNDLFPGSKSLDDGVNQFLNDNWKTAADAIKPIISTTIESIMLSLMQDIFHQFPGDFLVGDLPNPEKSSKSDSGQFE